VNLRAVLRGAGELLITLGVVALLFVAYQLWWTNVMADRAVRTQTSRLLEEFSHAPPGGAASQPVPLGQAFALMYIPALGVHWSRPVIQGVTLADLAEGVGHYPATAMPGQVGNFAVAGHRATNGQPFAYLDRVGAGDDVIVRTQQSWFVYRITDVHIVAPTDVGVIDPVPGQPTASPHDQLITLTTCSPRWASYARLILHGVLVQTSPPGQPPAEVGGA
jgi:sortase A